MSAMIGNILGQEKVVCIDINVLYNFRDLYASWEQSKNIPVGLSSFWDFLCNFTAAGLIQRYSNFRPDLYQTLDNQKDSGNY